MALLLVATCALLLSATVVALWLDLPNRSTAVTTALTLALVTTAGLSELTLAAGVFTRWVLASSACGLAGACLAATFVVPALKTRFFRGLTRFRRIAADDSPRSPWPLQVSAALAAAGLATTYLERIFVALRIPPLDWDSNYYHLVTAAGWVQTGHLVSPIVGLDPPNGPTYLVWTDSYPHVGEIFDSWLMVFPHSGRFVNLAQLPFAILLIAATYAIIRSFGARRATATLAAAIVGLTPITLAQVTTSYNDVSRGATLVAGWFFFVSAFRGPLARRRLTMLTLCGLAMGLSAGIKATSLPVAVATAGLAAVVAVAIDRPWARAEGRHAEAPTRPGWALGLRQAFAAALAVGVPALAAGSLWYIRAWVRWGSPFWPLKVAPFDGPVDTADVAQGGHGWASFHLTFDRWASGVSAMSHSVLYDSQSGSLGPAWIIILLPAIVLVTLAARRHRSALLWVVYPLLALNLYNDTRVQPRYVLAVTVAGALALATVIESVLTSRRPLRGALASVIAAVSLALGAWGAAAATIRPNWPINSYRDGTRVLLATLAANSADRANLGFWKDLNSVRDQVPSGTAIGILPNSIPIFTYPWVGPKLDHRLKLTDPATNPQQLAQVLQRAGVQYFLAPTLQMIPALNPPEYDPDLPRLLRADRSGRFTLVGRIWNADLWKFTEAR